MAGTPYPKTPAFRSQALRDLAKLAPYCMSCSGGHEGEMVGCHSDALEDGHGAGLKANDVLAYCCGRCHNIIDGRPEGGPVLPLAERRAMFYRAAYRTQAWLFREGFLRVVA